MTVLKYVQGNGWIIYAIVCARAIYGNLKSWTWLDFRILFPESFFCSSLWVLLYTPLNVVLKYWNICITPNVCKAKNM